MPIDLSSIKDSVVGAAGSLKDSVAGAADTVTDSVSGAANKAGDYMQSEDFQKILPYLLSGGAGAALGGVLTGRRREADGEGRLGHLRRILTNALIGGGLAGGSHWLLNKGVDQASGAADTLPDPTETQDSPLESTVRNMAFSPVTAAGAGVSGLLATDGSEAIGAGRKSQEGALRALAGRTGHSIDNLQTMTAKEIHDLGLNKADNVVRQKAGLGSGTGVRGLASVLRRKGLSTLGQTNPRMAMRGGIGLAAAGIPALLGAYLTQPSDKA